MANTLTGLSQTIYLALDTVSREQVGFIPACFKNSSAERAALNQSIVYPVTQPASAVDITPAQYAPNGAQTVANGSLTISKSRGIPITWNGEEQRGGLNAGWYSQVLQDQFAQSFRTLTNELEGDLAVEAQGFSRAYGTAGATPFATAADMTDLAETAKILKDNGAPNSDLHFVLNNSAAAKIRGKQSNLFKANEAGSDAMLRRGAIGNLEGFEVHESNQIGLHTAGGGTGYKVNNASNYAVGDTVIAADTGTGTILAGDTVTFAGDSNKYQVTSALSGGSFTIASPGLKAALADGTDITVGSAYTGNFAFNRMALHMVARVPAMPVGPDGKAMDMADDLMLVTDPISGITFQVAVYRQFQQLVYFVGLAWGVKRVKDAHGAILLG